MNKRQYFLSMLSEIITFKCVSFRILVCRQRLCSFINDETQFFRISTEYSSNAEQKLLIEIKRKMTLLLTSYVRKIRTQILQNKINRLM